MGEYIDGVLVFTQILGYWRFIQDFNVEGQTVEEIEKDDGIFITFDKKIFYKGKLIAKFKPKDGRD